MKGLKVIDGTPTEISRYLRKMKSDKELEKETFNDICDNCIHNEVCYDLVEFGERQGECGSFISKQKIQGVKGE